jgi:hypothetical protein
MLIVLHFLRFCKRKMQDFKKSRQNSRNIHFFQTFFLSNASDAAVPCGRFSWVTITQNIFLIAIVKRM